MCSYIIYYSYYAIFDDDVNVDADDDYTAKCHGEDDVIALALVIVLCFDDVFLSILTFPPNACCRNYGAIVLT